MQEPLEARNASMRAPLLPPPSPQYILNAIDWLGRPAHARLGGWKCASCILGAIALCFLAFYGILFNLVMFLVQDGAESNAAAATTVTNLSGTLFLSSFLGALLSDAYLGRLWTTLIFQVLSALSSVLVGISVVLVSSTGSGRLFLIISLYLMAMTTGPILPSMLGLGLDQLNSNEEREIYFQLVAIATALGQLLAATAVTYVDNGGMWVWGFSLCAIASLLCLALTAGALRWFRQHRAAGNPFLRNFQVLVAALRKHRLALPKDSTLLYECKGDLSAIPGCPKLPHTCTLSFLDKAAVPEVVGKSSRWHLCTVTQVEELKSLLRVIPAGFAMTFISTAVMQVSTLFEEQAVLMNRHLGAWFVVPPATLNVLSTVSGIVTGLVTTAGSKAKLSHWCFMCIKHRATWRATSLLLVGVSLMGTIIALVIAALVESYRLNVSRKGHTISVLWLAPQTMLLGAALNLATSSSLDFFYSEISDSMRCVGGCIVLILCGAGSYINSILVAVVTSITSHGGKSGWIAEDLDEGHIDYFYWFLASWLALGLCFHTAYARAYKYTVR